LELRDIEAIIDLMKKNDLAVFKLERDGFKLELEANRLPAATLATAQTPQVLASIPRSGGPEATSPASGPGAAADKTVYKEIVSPMVGTYYSAASPDSAPYSQVGQEVSADSVVCIIEAMKVMNEIKAELSGTIVEILVENGTAVQFGQPLFRVK
jgi:acetyl-CoA carboxylase biotin carboxyl carrier protein